MRWEWKDFDQMNASELYEVLRLRTEVFIVEQNCVYQDCDGMDPRCRHLLGRSEDGALAAYLRLVPAKAKYPEASLGRVITSSAVRGSGAGKEMIAEALRFTGKKPLRISAQKYLEKFYGDFGFTSVGKSYLEDGIPHIEMVRP